MHFSKFLKSYGNLIFIFLFALIFIFGIIFLTTPTIFANTKVFYQFEDKEFPDPTVKFLDT